MTSQTDIYVVTGADGLHFPWCLALTSKGKLAVSEDYSWSIKLFELPGEFMANCFIFNLHQKIKSSLCSRYYDEACNE